MRVPVSWLREFIDTDATAERIAEGLTMCGVEVASLEEITPSFSGVKAAQVLGVKEHPLSDDLLVVSLHYGQGNAEVVTGAKNLKIGQMVPLALPDAVLARGKVIKGSIFKGHLSQGMLCSVTELLTGEEHREGEGILILGHCRPGEDVAGVLGWRDTVLELDLTPNYAHCLSLVGVAQEVKASSGGRYRYRARSPRETTENIEALLGVTIEEPDLCNRYSARLFRRVAVGPSPAWLQFRLWCAGIRPINNVVDVTNYVMVELGQPLHAFDFDMLRRPHIIVRLANEGERLITLDGQDRTLDSGMLIIADPEGALALAGVMGGEETEITASTNSVLLESASFDPGVTGRTSRRLGLRSEASNRFEKGTDVSGTVAALDRSAVIMGSIGAAMASRGVIDEYPRPVGLKPIRMRPQRVNEVLGTSIPAGEISRILKRLGFGVSGSGRRFYEVTVPVRRVDVTAEVDLIEEVARVHGYDRIPTTMPRGAATAGSRPPKGMLEDHARDLMVSLGLTEVNTYSFVHPRVFDLMRLSPEDPSRDALVIANPLKEDQSIMRTVLLPNLLAVLAGNLKRNVEDAGVFELSRVYKRCDGFPGVLPLEPSVLAIAGMGRLCPRAWRHSDRAWDFYILKGMLERLFEEFGVKVSWETSDHPSFASGRQAKMLSNGDTLGWAGDAHQGVLEGFEIDVPVVMATVDFEMIWQRSDLSRRYVAPPRYPGVRRDIAVVVPDEMPAATVEGTIMKAAGGLLEDLFLFDVYSGKPIPSGHRSLAYGLLYRSSERTLLDNEVDAVHEGVRRVLSHMGLAIR